MFFNFPSWKQSRRVVLRSSRCALLLATAGAMTSCGSNPNQMAGTWLFNLLTQASLQELRATVNLSQSGNNISGTANISATGSSCVQTISGGGTINGNDLHLQFTQSQVSIDLRGEVNSAFTFASGTYALNGVLLCLQSLPSGTWSASFVKS